MGKSDGIGLAVMFHRDDQGRMLTIVDKARAVREQASELIAESRQTRALSRVACAASRALGKRMAQFDQGRHAGSTTVHRDPEP